MDPFTTGVWHGTGGTSWESETATWKIIVWIVNTIKFFVSEKCISGQRELLLEEQLILKIKF